MGGVDIGEKMLILPQFLKVMLTKYCTVEQKKSQFLKTHVNNSKKQTRGVSKHQKPLILMKLSTKTVRKAARKPVDPSTREAQR